MKSLIYPQVLIFVAKDHEKNAMDQIFTEQRIKLTQVDNAGGTFAFAIGDHSCCLSWLNDMGWTSATNHASKTIKELCPSYVGILGSCAGVKEDVGKVWFFEAASFYPKEEDTKTIEAIYPVPRQMKPESLWRAYEEENEKLKASGEIEIPNPVKRDKDNIPTIFTIKTRSTAGPEFASFACTQLLQKKNVTIFGIKKDDAEKLSIHGVEMEVAAIWKVIQEWNNHNKNSQITCLPAAKGVSDSGSDEERQEHMIPVIQKATQLLIQYLKSQLKYLK